MNYSWIFALIVPFQLSTVPNADTLAKDYSPNYAESSFIPESKSVKLEPDTSQESAKDELVFLFEQEPILQIKRSELTKNFLDFPLVDSAKLIKISDDLDKIIRKDAVNATLDVHGNIVSEQAGIEVNKRAFTEQFYRHFYKNESSNFDVPVRIIYPRVDSELLTTIRTKMVGHYVTYYNSGNKERSKNIYLAAKAINNHVVFPGEVFSFNKTVGKRTKAKGYQIAPIIVRGELSEDVGGGICQVSSTLYNAVDRSGLKVLERFSHSKRVPYVPPGRDATVSWYGPDFTFKNEYNQPVLIRTKVVSGMVIVFILSSEDINVKKNQVPNANAKLPPEMEVRRVNH